MIGLKKVLNLVNDAVTLNKPLVIGRAAEMEPTIAID